eukprot:3904459-Prymnesium_polylepis.1
MASKCYIVREHDPVSSAGASSGPPGRMGGRAAPTGGRTDGVSEENSQTRTWSTWNTRQGGFVTVSCELEERIGSKDLSKE